MLRPGLSMLWEPVDAAEALRDRFGFRSRDDAATWLTRTLAEGWEVAATGCDRLVISDRHAIAWVRSAVGPLVVKWSCDRGRFPALAAAAELLPHLGAAGVPVAVPRRTVDGSVRVVRDGPASPLSLVVLPEITGTWLDVTDEAAVRAAGACLARVHDGLRGRSDERLIRGHGGGRVDVALRQWVEGGGRPSLPASARLVALAADLPALDDETQLVHHDFRAANLLMRGAAVGAVLDFDEVGWGHRVGDLAKASVYLGTRFTDWRPTPASTRRQLRVGYESVRRLTPAEERWLAALTLWYGIGAVPSGPDPAGWAEAL